MDFLFLAVQRLVGILSFSSFDLRELVEEGEGLFRLLARAEEAPASSAASAHHILMEYMLRLEEVSNQMPGWMQIRASIHLNLPFLLASKDADKLGLSIKEINYQLQLAKACKRAGVVSEEQLQDLASLARRIAETVSKKNRLACLAAEAQMDANVGIDLDHPELTEWVQPLVAAFWKDAFSTISRKG